MIVKQIRTKAGNGVLQTPHPTDSWYRVAFHHGKATHQLHCVFLVYSFRKIRTAFKGKILYCLCQYLLEQWLLNTQQTTNKNTCRHDTFTTRLCKEHDSGKVNELSCQCFVFLPKYGES